MHLQKINWIIIGFIFHFCDDFQNLCTSKTVYNLFVPRLEYTCIILIERRQHKFLRFVSRAHSRRIQSRSYNYDPVLRTLDTLTPNDQTKDASSLFQITNNHIDSPLLFQPVNFHACLCSLRDILVFRVGLFSSNPEFRDPFARICNFINIGLATK